MVFVCLMTMVVSANAQSYTRQEIKSINLQIMVAEAEYKSLDEIDGMKAKRDKMVSTFSIEDKTLKFGMTMDEAKSVMDICGHWSTHSSSFTEEGKIELLHFDVFNTFYLNGNSLTNDNNYMLTFIDGKLKKLEVAENTAQKWDAKIKNIKGRVESIRRRM